MNSRQRFLAACARRPLSRPPLWIMRQAGRYLPEYRKLKDRHGFLGLVKKPELATHVTLMPIRRFGFDAAIIFSDILVIPEALGMPYEFRESGGIKMAYTISSQEHVNQLSVDAISEKLQYVVEAIRLSRQALKGETALIGFGGSPWTLASFMVEGGSSKDYARIKSLLYADNTLFDSLMNRITDALIKYFEMQIEAGVDALQIFDSFGGILSEHTFWDGSAKYMARIVRTFKGKVPIIVFSKGAHHWLDDLKKTNADVLGIDWTVSISRFYDALDGKFAVQGNLDPTIMNTTPEVVKWEAQRILDGFGKRNGHIFNLGHGILPDAKIECVEALVDTVRGYDKSA